MFGQIYALTVNIRFEILAKRPTIRFMVKMHEFASMRLNYAGLRLCAGIENNEAGEIHPPVHFFCQTL